MARVYHKSSIPNDKPQWMLNIQEGVSQATGMVSLQGDERDFHNLQMFIDASIRAEQERGNILRGTSVKTELRTDEGKTVIHIFRNQIIVQTYFIE